MTKHSQIMAKRSEKEDRGAIRDPTLTVMQMMGPEGRRRTKVEGKVETGKREEREKHATFFGYKCVMTYV